MSWLTKSASRLRWLAPVVLVAFGCCLTVQAGTISYTCDTASGVSAATCSYLNTTIGGLYSSTFTEKRHMARAAG